LASGIPTSEAILRTGNLVVLRSSETPYQTVFGNSQLGGVANPFLKASDWGWQIDPKGLRRTASTGIKR